jgi:uncharacterized protein YlxW (UPF0749 family)
MAPAGGNPRQELQDQLRRAYEQGKLDETVRTVQERMGEMASSIRDIQVKMNDLNKAMVMREEFEILEVKVQSLTKFQWSISTGLGLLLALSQILPRVVDFLQKP